MRVAQHLELQLADRLLLHVALLQERRRQRPVVVDALTLARTTTFIACWPKSSELTVSNWSVIVGATHTTSVVFAFLPIAFEQPRQLDSRKRGFSFLLDARTSMVRPSVVSDRLIALASSKAAPSTPDFLTRSEPARSTR